MSLRGCFIVLITVVLFSDSRTINHNPYIKTKKQRDQQSSWKGTSKVTIPWFLYTGSIKMNGATFCDFRHVTWLVLTFFSLSVAQCNKTAMEKRCFFPLSFMDIEN